MESTLKQRSILIQFNISGREIRLPIIMQPWYRTNMQIAGYVNHISISEKKERGGKYLFQKFLMFFTSNKEYLDSLSVILEGMNRDNR